MTAPDPLADIISWSETNPEAWEQVVAWAHDDRARGYAPSTRLYCCLLRRPHLTSRLHLSRQIGSPVLVNDHLSSGMARLLNRRYPGLQVPERAARVDSWGVTP